MLEFLAALQAFPTVAFTGLLVLVLLYWLTVIVGALDIDLFGIGGHDAGHEIAHGSHGFLSDILSLGQVPVTITLSIFALVGWSIGMLAEFHLRSWLGVVLPGPLYSIILGVVMVLASALFAGWAVRPLRRLFVIKEERGEQGLVGRMVKITSLKADRAFGTGVCDDGGPGIIMQVVCRDGVVIKRDDMAVVVEYDAARGVYLVAPFAHVSPDTAISAESPASLAGDLPPSTPARVVSLESQNKQPH